MTGTERVPADEGLDWSRVSEEMARLIMQQGETFLQAQLQAGLASDHRAMTSASILVALSSAAVAASIAYWTETNEISIMAAGLVAAALFGVGAFLCGWAARPVDFYYPGNQPHNWFDCRDGHLSEVLGGEAENYDVRIEANDQTLIANHRALGRGILFAISAPVVAVVVWFAVLTFVSSPETSPTASSLSSVFVAPQR